MWKLWHEYRLTVLTAMYRDCIDNKMKNKLNRKIEHHVSKLNVNSEQNPT